MTSKASRIRMGVGARGGSTYSRASNGRPPAQEARAVGSAAEAAAAVATAAPAAETGWVRHSLAMAGQTRLSIAGQDVSLKDMTQAALGSGSLAEAGDLARRSGTGWLAKRLIASSVTPAQVAGFALLATTFVSTDQLAQGAKAVAGWVGRMSQARKAKKQGGEDSTPIESLNQDNQDAHQGIDGEDF